MADNDEAHVSGSAENGAELDCFEILPGPSDWTYDGKAVKEPGRLMSTVHWDAYGKDHKMKGTDGIKITDFEDYNYLEHYGENYFQPVKGATEKDGNYTINQGYLETSNVQVVQEMVEMISVSRQYETNQRMITTIDSTLEIASRQLGRV